MLGRFFKALTAICAAFAVVLLPLNPVAKAVGATMHGDLDVDFKITSADLLMLKEHLIGVSSSKEYALSADMNNDCQLGTADYLRLELMLLGVKQPEDNLFDGFSWEYGQGLNYKTGQATDNASASCTDFIPVKSNTTYGLNVNDISYGFTLSVYYYDTNNGFVEYVTMPYNRMGVWTFAPPADEAVAFMRFELCHGGGTQDKLCPANTVLKDVTDNRLAGRSILTFGDSIVAGSANNYYSFAHIIAQTNFMHLTNKSIGGSTLFVDESVKPFNILSQVNDTDSSLSPDYILFNGLTNDALITVTDKDRIGSITDGRDDELDITTFCGGLEATVRTIQSKWPDATLLFITTHKNGARDLEAQDTLTDLAIEICNKYQVSVVDIYHNSGLDTFDQAQMDEYIADGGSHPNTLGHKLFYFSQINSALKKIN